MRTALLRPGIRSYYYGTSVAKVMAVCKCSKLVGVISGTPSKIIKWQSEHNKQGYKIQLISDIEKLLELAKK